GRAQAEDPGPRRHGRGFEEDQGAPGKLREKKEGRRKRLPLPYFFYLRPSHCFPDVMARIPESFINDLVNRLDIVEVIDSRVPLKKAGREYQACCPFHNEKTPSFTVSPTKQFFHCFGCGAHGTALGFLMDYEHMEVVDAVEELARSAGLEVPRERQVGAAQDRTDVTTPLYELLDQAAKYFRQQLRQHPDAGRAVDYLKRRGLSGEVAQAYGLGYAPAGWDNLL